MAHQLEMMFLALACQATKGFESDDSTLSLTVKGGWEGTQKAESSMKSPSDAVHNAP